MYDNQWSEATISYSKNTTKMLINIRIIIKLVKSQGIKKIEYVGYSNYVE